MTQTSTIQVDGFKYEVSIAARSHIFEVLERYESTKKATDISAPAPPVEAQPRTISSDPKKKPIFRKDKKK